MAVSCLVFRDCSNASNEIIALVVALELSSCVDTDVTVVRRVLALLGLLWSALFYVLIFERPRDHPTISEEELLYIEKSIADIKCLYTDNETGPKGDIPWTSILLSLPVWAICSAHFARGWTFYLLLTNQPAFLNAFGFGVTENGTLGSLPHIMKVIVALLSGFIADFLRLSLFWSTTNVRKLMTCTGERPSCSSTLDH